MPSAAIALGSNLGDRERNLRQAIAQVARLGQVLAVSSFHDTAPVGYTDQPRFLNGALLLETALAPHPLLLALLGIEQTMGRDRSLTPAKGPRLVDLDLLLYDRQILHTPQLTVPHPAMKDRAFVLAPLAEIAPDWRHPLSGLTIRQLLTQLRPLVPTPCSLPCS